MRNALTALLLLVLCGTAVLLAENQPVVGTVYLSPELQKQLEDIITPAVKEFSSQLQNCEKARATILVTYPVQLKILVTCIDGEKGVKNDVRLLQARNSPRR